MISLRMKTIKRLLIQVAQHLQNAAPREREQRAMEDAAKKLDAEPGACG
jgi:hypothetical protein